MLNLAESKVQMIGNGFMRDIQFMCYLAVIEPITPAHQKNSIPLPRHFTNQHTDMVFNFRDKVMRFDLRDSRLGLEVRSVIPLHGIPPEIIECRIFSDMEYICPE